MKKMLLAVVPKNMVEQVLDDLTRKGYTATYNESRGGAMHQTKRSVFLVVEETLVEEVKRIIRANVSPSTFARKSIKDKSEISVADATIGGTVIFTWDIDTMEII